MLKSPAVRKKASLHEGAGFSLRVALRLRVRVLLDLGLGGGETGDGNAERGAGDVVDADRSFLFECSFRIINP